MAPQSETAELPQSRLQNAAPIAGQPTGSQVPAPTGASETAALSALAPGAQCLPFAPTVVTLTGTLTPKTFPQPPHPEGAGAETFWILSLGKPICAAAGEVASPNPGEGDVWNVQLLFGSVESYQPYLPLLKRQVKVTGTLFSATTPHHYTKVVLEVAGMEAAGVSKADDPVL